MHLNMLLGDVGLDLVATRLLRHQDARATKGRTPYKLWLDERAQFELYQSQKPTNEGRWEDRFGTPASEYIGRWVAEIVG